MNNIQMYTITTPTVNFKANGSKLVTKAAEKTTEVVKDLAVPAAATLAAMAGVKTVSDSKKAAEKDEIRTKLTPQAIEIMEQMFNKFGNQAVMATGFYNEGFENLKKHGVMEKRDDGALQIVGKTDSVNYKFISKTDDHSLLDRIEVLDKNGKIIQKVSINRDYSKPYHTVGIVQDDGAVVFNVYDNEREYELEFVACSFDESLMPPGSIHQLVDFGNGQVLATTSEGIVMLNIPD